jgi:hypothetical protein|tara:strand:+ start:2649 stop:2864 length:216 start_codon:yes stop_codon:yes gene_type:complete
MQISQHDKILLSELKHSPGYKPLVAMLEKKKEEQLDQVVVTQLFDQKSVGRHNVAIGKIQVLQELLEVLQA